MRRLRGAEGAGGPRRLNTATPFVVPTYTCPLTIVGVMNLFPAPNPSRPAGACFELKNSRDKSRASTACRTSGFVFSTAQRIAFVAPFAEMLGVAPGYPNTPVVLEAALEESR